jgi:hypothetical protein
VAEAAQVQRAAEIQRTLDAALETARTERDRIDRVELSQAARDSLLPGV